jgi:hypothetical protein
MDDTFTADCSYKDMQCDVGGQKSFKGFSKSVKNIMKEKSAAMLQCKGRAGVV